MTRTLDAHGSAGRSARSAACAVNKMTPIPETITLHVPFKLTKRGGRKLMLAPDGVECTPRSRVDSALVKALARAHRWQRMLDSGEFATIRELAEREGVTPSFLTRILRLTLLAPNIVEAILEGKQGPEVTLARVLEPFPADWDAQRLMWGTKRPTTASRERAARDRTPSS